MPRRQALVFGAAGSPAAVCCGLLSAAGIGLCGFVCRSFCRRRAASTPSGLRPSPSHRCAAGPSLYKRGCLRLRNSPAASRPSVLRPATASRVQNGPSCTRPRPVTTSRVQNGSSCSRPRPATASRVQNGPSCPRHRPTGEPGTDGRWSEGRK